MRQTITTGIILLIITGWALWMWNHDDRMDTAQAKIILQPAQAVSHRQDQGKLTQALRLAAQSTQLLADTYDSLAPSVLLATESMRRQPTVEGNIALRRGASLLFPRPTTQLDLPEEGLIDSAVFSPDLHQVATTRMKGIIQIRDVTTGQVIAQMKHEDQVESMRFSPDGQQLASGSEDKTARIWNVATGQEIIRVSHKNRVNSVALSPDGQWLATGSADHTAKVWEVTTGRELAKMSLDDVVNAVAFSSDSKWLATAGEDHTARIWDITTGKELNRLSHGGPVASVTFSPNGHWLITTSWGFISIWDLNSGVLVSVLAGKGTEVVAVSPDSRWIATGSGGRFNLWDITTGKEIARTLVDEFHSVAVAFSADNQQLATATLDGKIDLWPIEALPGLLLKGNTAVVEKVIFSPDSRWLAAQARDHTVRLWSMASRQEAARIHHDQQITDLTFSPDSQWLATGGYDNTAQILHVTQPNAPMLLKHDGPVKRIMFSPDGRWLATASNDGTARIWEVGTGAEAVHLKPGTRPINDLDFSLDSQQLVTGSDDSTARIWEVATGKEINRFEHEPFRYNDQITFTWQIKDVTLSTDGKWLVAQSEFPSTAETFFEARVWNIVTHQAVITRPWFAVLSPDGTKVALHSSGDIGISSLPPSEHGIQLAHPGSRQRVVFSADSKLLASGSWNPRYEEGDVYIWDITTGAQLAYVPLETYQEEFSPDDQWLAGFTTQGLRVWDTATGREMMATPGVDLEFSPDGRWLAVSEDEVIHLLYLQPDDLIADACARLPRNMTRLEWQQYIGDEPYQATCPNLPLPEN